MSALRPLRRKDRNKDQYWLDYMKWVKTLKCVGCCQIHWTGFISGLWFDIPSGGRSEAAHIGGTLGAKAPNSSCIPLCTRCHRDGPDSQEVSKLGWFEHRGLDYEALLKALHEAFAKHRGGDANDRRRR